MSTTSDFFRLRIIPPAATAHPAWLDGAWLAKATDPIEIAPGQFVFGALSTVAQRKAACVYVKETACQLADHLRGWYPRLELVPATFDEWIEWKEESA